MARLDEQDILRRDLEDLTAKVDALTLEVRGLLQAWNTANNLVAFLKGLATVVVACGVIAAAIKGFFMGVPK